MGDVIRGTYVFESVPVSLGVILEEEAVDDFVFVERFSGVCAAHTVVFWGRPDSRQKEPKGEQGDNDC